MKLFLRLLAILCLLALVAVGATGWWLWQEIQKPYGSYSAEQTVLVEPGTGASKILQLLGERGILREPLLARAYLVYYLDDPPLRAGEYRFDAPLSTPEVLDKLIRGEVVTYPVTLIEGLTLDETAESLADDGFGDREVFRREMNRADLVHDLDNEAEDLEGYLYPDTYHFSRETTEAEIVETLVRTYRKRFRDQVEPLLVGSELTVRELTTLASIIEKEAQLDEERPIIASVYANRLRIGMALYADPTVIFALKKQGTWDGNLRRPDLQFDSPYNTYVYAGLPPGPICSPGVASMVAAAKPAETSHLYFVSKNDGSHVFANTLREHNRNVYIWQKQYWRKRWAEEKRGR